MKRHLLLWVSIFAALIALLSPSRAVAVDRNFAGSAQLDYHLASERLGRDGKSQVFDGFTVETGLKLSVDISEHFSANVKVCVGCHGFETDMAYLDYRVADELNFRFGRFSPSFGAFNLRHDPANHRLSDKPLVYDMGRMLRMRDWNMGVLPSPFPDNGLEVNGTHWFGDKMQLDYAAYVVSGFKGQTAGTDLDFVQSRSGSLYYVDNNSRPAFGSRVALTARIAKNTDVTFGGSGMAGTFDPENNLWYAILGGELSFRFDRTNLRFEYLARRQSLDISDPTIFKYDTAQNGDFFLKHGGYGELEVPVNRNIDLIGRFDFLYRSGNVPVASELSARSGIFRYTLGSAITIERGVRLKLSTELWSFSDRGVAGKHTAVSSHLGFVGAF